MTARNRLYRSLDGLSVGDSFGERFFGVADDVVPRIVAREIPAPPWHWTDDTQMAVGLARVVHAKGEVDQDLLATEFAANMEPARGYGRGAFEILSKIKEGQSWRRASRSAFGGLGSFGNGGAMRVAPLGAFFADRDLEWVARQAALSAEITHAHAEGVAGAIAVAVAAALAAVAPSQPSPLGPSWLRAVRNHVPRGYTRETIDEALDLANETPVVEAALALGNGSGVTAPDTVPFCLWICAHRSGHFEEALWDTVSALGDRDTTCAIVGGILGARQPPPTAWTASREPLPDLSTLSTTTTTTSP